MLNNLVLISVFCTFASGVLAQQPAYSQCGGLGWTGGTTCVTGSSCVYSNDWYSQCVPGAGSPGTTASTTITSAPGPTSTNAAAPNFWFSFGDSYTQTGFNPSGTLPNVGNPLGNPAYPGNTAVGGTDWIDSMTVTYNRSLVFTYNYAVGGATIDANLVKPYGGVTMTDQVNQFLSGAGKKPASTPWTSSNALFSIWIGINDIGATFGSGGDRAAFSDKLLSAEFALVEKLYSAGARNFLFINVPAVDRSPMIMGQGGSSLEKGIITTHNTKYAAKISAFKASHSDVQTWVWDSNAAFVQILNSPATYGFNTNVNTWGGAKDFWGNNYHPSPLAHTTFAQRIRQVLGNTIW
jgi:phospholipase/lecithinase/hemolysin